MHPGSVLIAVVRSKEAADLAHTPAVQRAARVARLAETPPLRGSSTLLDNCSGKPCEAGRAG